MDRLKLSETYFNIIKEPGWFTKFFWWLSGADTKVLAHCPYADHVKYFGLGGIVLTTGILAALSGGYAFYTVFSPDIADELTTNIIHWKAFFQASFFGVIWGLIILNLDRFIIASSGIGDGSGKISWKTILHASPRIFMAIVLSVVIAAPLELRIFDSEIDAELFQIQNEQLLVLNKITDSAFVNRIDEIVVHKHKLEKKIAELEELIKAQEIKYQEEIAGRVSGIPGAGSAAKSIRDYVDHKLKPELVELKASSVGPMAKLESQKDSLLFKKYEAYTMNKKQVQNMDGLLQRLIIAHEIAGWKLTWLIRLIFIVIETAPIFFKMMMADDVYEAIQANLKSYILKHELNYTESEMKGLNSEVPNSS